jgi:Ca2+-binding RTX toxin-like protein
MAIPTAQEQLILELINRARLDPLAEAARLGIDLNQGLPAGTIAAAQKQVLAFNPKLNDAADAHSSWMLAEDTFDHTGSGGSDPGQRMADAHYVFSGDWTWGENIAWTGTTGTVNETASAAQLHDNLFRSAGHRTNILENDFKEIGIGAVVGQFTRLGTTYNALMATENFARSGSDNFISGAIFADGNANAFYDVGEGQGGVSVEFRQGATLVGTAASWAAGGYALATAATGSLKATFTGGAVAAPAHAVFAAGVDNIKLDLINGNTVQSTVSTTISGGALNLTLLGLANINGAGSSAANTLTGNKGANILSGAAGNDRLFGGDGNDRLAGGAGADALNGGAGIDTADYRAEAGVALNLATGVHGGAAAGDTFALVEYFFGSNLAADSFAGGAAGERFYGGAGADTMAGGGGNDALFGGAGTDLIDGGTGNDTLSGGTEADTFSFEALFGRDKVADFQDGVDKLRFDLAVADGFADFAIANNGTAAVTVGLGAYAVTVVGAAAITLTAADFEFLA